MVGVAGRSRGCKTCRRRRVKCDEHHPTCKRCEKAGYTCEGYQDRNFIIFDNTIKHENAVQSYKLPQKEQDNKSETSSCATTDFNSLSPRSFATDLTRPEDQNSQRGSPPKSPPLLVSPPMNRMQVYMGYMFVHLYRGATGRAKIFDVPGADIVNPSSLTYASVEALSTSFFGFRTGTQDIMVDGQRLYGMVLTRLNHSLAHRSPKDDCNVLASIVMLCLFEFLMPASITGWISHALGLGGMFKLLGPELCSQHPYHTYFETCRLLIIYAQLTLRFDSFLADKEWLTIPWLTRPEGKTPSEEICDVLTQLCRVQKYWDDVVKQQNQDKRNRLILRYQKQLDLCFKELQNWASVHKAACEASRTVIPYQKMNSTLNDKIEDNFGTSIRPERCRMIYDYPSLDTANVLCLYHGIYVLLSIFIHNPPPPTFVGLYPEPSPHPEKDTPLYNTILESGTEIARSADFHLLEYQDSAGSFHLIFPMRMCVRAFEETRFKPEEKWANGVLRSIAMGSNRQWAFAGKIVRENGKDVHQFRIA